MRWQDGYPRDNNSTDFCDSARLAGIMALFDYPDFEIPSYFDKWGNVVRSNKSDIPYDQCFNPTTTSRDQLIPLIAGFKKQKTYRSIASVDAIEFWLEERKWICPNGDIMSPSHRNIFKENFIGNMWLLFDVLWSCFIDPMAEPNQLISLMKSHSNKKYLKLWTRFNKKWREAIREYFCSKTPGVYDRGEPELAELMIKTIESDIR